MGLRLPRVSVRVEGAQGAELGAFGGEAIGLALLVTLALSVAQVGGVPGQPPVSLTFRASCCLACAGALVAGGLADKRFHALFRTLAPAFAGVALLLASLVPIGLTLVTDGPAKEALRVAGGALMGAGAAMLVFLWGIAFGRREVGDVTLNAAAGVGLAIVFFSLVVSRMSGFWVPLVTCALQALHLPLLRRRVTYTLPDADMRYATYFGELNIRRGTFALKLVPSMLFLGLVCGSVLTHAGYVMSPATGAAGEGAAVLAALAGSSAVVGCWAALHRAGHSFSHLFRLVMPLVALLVLPLAGETARALSVANVSLLAALTVVLAMCWAFLGSMAQEFRLSPVFVFGLGVGGMVAGYLAATPVSMLARPLAGGLMSDEAFGLVACLFGLMVACGLFPRREDILAIVVRSYRPTELWGADAVLDGACARCARGLAGVCEREEGGAASQAGGAPGAGDSARGAGEGAGGCTGTSGELPRSHGGTPYREAQATSGAASEGDGEEVRKGRFVRRCEYVADTYLLSRRETDVLFLLAKGRNVSFICSQLCISEGTAKTHVNHVYKKLGVHSRQELIELIDSFE